MRTGEVSMFLVAGLAAAVPPASERKVGQTYQTPRGPMIWRGSGWEPA
jgi:hypothetical protein